MYINNNMNNIDRIFYINLEKRNDRYDQINNEFVKLNLDNKIIERYDAVYIPHHTCLGCTISHLNVLKISRERNYKNVLIFEDDFEFLVDEQTFKDGIYNFFKKGLDFKVVMLSYHINHKEYYDDLVSITHDAQTASGYIVNSKYYDEIIDCLENGAKMLELTGEHWHYINDQVWKSLQKDNKWFIFNNRIGKQRESFSDLTGQIVNYNQ